MDSIAPTHVALFLPDLSGGGAERMIVNLGNALAERGHRVDLILAKAGGVYEDIVSDKVRVVDLGAKNPMLSLPALVRYLREAKPKSLMAALNQPNVVAAWAKRLTGTNTKVVLGIRNTLSMEAKNAESARMRLMPGFIKRFAPWADEIVAVSQGAADDAADLIGIPRDRVKVIYNPVVDEALLAAAKERPDHPFFAAGAPPVVLATGRLTPQKDYPTLLRAFAKVRQQREARLLILGEGPERESLEGLVKELGLETDVELPGFNAKPFGFMGHCDVFVLSSLFEGLPGVLIQALAAGAPVIATDCPSGPREILDEDRYGRLVPVGDVDAIAAAILDTLAKPKASPPPESWEPFRVERVIRQYEELLAG